MKCKTYSINKDAIFMFDGVGGNHNDVAHLKLQELAWKKYLAKDTPMGSLFLKNKLFSSIEEDKKIIALHATTNLNLIKESKKMYCSGGSFGGCIYCVPLRRDKKLHNLMQYILKKELPGFMRHKKGKVKQDLLGIKISGLSMNSVKKVNYMDFGGMYSDIFLRLLKQDQFSKNQIKELKADIYNQVKAMRHLLDMLLDFEKLNNCSSSEFVNLFESATNDAVVMKIAYFETILEYCFLFQNDSAARRKLEEGELNNFEVKTMIFRLNPKLFQEFNLKHFKESINKIIEYLKECSRQNVFITDFSEEHFLNFFKWRFAHNVRFHFLKGHLNWDKRMVLDEFVRKNKSLAGHMILRSDKNTFDFEALFAKEFWMKMNEAKATILTYENLPKGEIGIIPSNKLKYEVYNTDSVKGRFNLADKLNIILVKNLVGANNTIMRTHYGKN